MLLVLRLTMPLQVLPKEEVVQIVVEFMNEYSLNQEYFDAIVEYRKEGRSIEGFQLSLMT